MNDRRLGADVPMNWHNFLVSIGCWMFALDSALSAVTYFRGGMLNVDVQELYAQFPGMRAVNIAMAVFSAAMVVLAVMMRASLAGYEKKGPRMLEGYLIVSAAGSVLYVVLSSVMMKLPVTLMTVAPTVASVAVMAGMIAFNRHYYGKRKHLFVR